MLKVAVPVVDGRLSMHFGHCERFAFFEVDEERKSIVRQEMVPAPPHQPGFLPSWMASHKVDMVIAGGMGHRAITLFSQYGITVITGAPPEDPEAVVKAYFTGTLQRGENLCSHGDDHHSCGGHAM